MTPQEKRLRQLKQMLEGNNNDRSHGPTEQDHWVVQYITTFIGQFVGCVGFDLLKEIYPKHAEILTNGGGPETAFKILADILPIVSQYEKLNPDNPTMSGPLVYFLKHKGYDAVEIEEGPFFKILGKDKSLADDNAPTLYAAQDGKKRRRLVA